jgi:hypothetical protein
MYYVIVFLALIVVMAVLIVLRTVAINPQRDEVEQVEQDETPAATVAVAQPAPAATEEPPDVKRNV